MATKTCSKCGEERAVESEFYRRRDGSLNPWCKSCYREYYRGRGGYSTTRAATCDWCDSLFTTAYARSLFCSKKCKVASARARQRGQPRRKPDRECVWCGVPMPRRMRSDAKFCSEVCMMAAHHQARTFRRRLGEASQRPRKTPLANLAAIAEIDNWRCGHCGGRIDRERKHPDPLAASIDHVIPVSKGGTNDVANLRIVHFRCNWSRGNRA